MTGVSFRLYSKNPRGRQTEQLVTMNQTSSYFSFSASFRNNFQEASMDNDNSFIGGYAVPVDPMDDLQCDSCQ